MAVNSEEAVELVCGISSPVIRDLLLLVHDTWVQLSVMKSDPRSVQFDQLFAYQVLAEVFSRQDQVIEALRSDQHRRDFAASPQGLANAAEAIRMATEVEDAGVRNLLQLVHEALSHLVSQGHRTPRGCFDLHFFYEILRAAFSRKDDVETALKGRLEAELWDWLGR